MIFQCPVFHNRLLQLVHVNRLQKIFDSIMCEGLLQKFIVRRGKNYGAFDRHLLKYVKGMAIPQFYVHENQVRFVTA